MGGGTGETGEALDAARAALAAADDDLAAADEALTGVVRRAQRLAADCLARLDAVRSEIDAAAAAGPAGSATAGAEFGRFLVAKNREVIDIINAARADIAASAVALRDLGERYRSSAQR